MIRTEADIHRVLNSQKNFFKTGETLDLDFRIHQLKRLKTAIRIYEADMIEALAMDLGRHEAEAYFCDIGSTLMEIDEIIRDIGKWARPETHFSGIACFPSVTTKVYKMPYGNVLIISPYNFPFLLSLGVLAIALAGGNTVMIKASSKTPNCTEVLGRILEETYPDELVSVVAGGHDLADACLDSRFNKIFYTGSPKVGKHVMRKAAENLTPVALELGGENGNWCIVRKDADIKDAARKIAFMKMLNSGQVCININQVAVASEIADEFIRELHKAFLITIGEDATANEEYPRLITKEAYDKCAEEADKYRDRIVYGGYGDRDKLKYSPTVIYPVDVSEDIVKHELFNPLLPIVPFDDDKVDALLDVISEREHGLALYVFTKDVKWAKKIMAQQQFGGGCINEVCLHLMVKGVPFNGTGHSGMGAYHGEWGFREFTHPQTVLIGKRKFNLNLREHPYDAKKLKLLRLFQR